MSKAYVNGAWQEVPPKYQIDGAYQEMPCAKAYVNGAWQEIWSNTQDLYMLLRTTKTGAFYDNEGNWDNDFWCIAIDDGGEIILVVDGEFTNPVISFIYSGGASYCTSDGEWRDTSAGYIYSYGVKNGTVYNSENSVKVGSSDGYSDDSAEFTLEGTYTRIGLRVKFSNWDISPDTQGNINPCNIFIKNVMIDGKKYVTRNEDSYDYEDF